MLVFAATEVLPGDAASAVLGRSATPEQVDQLRAQMGLDRPAAQRYAEWLGGLLTGDLGDSASGFASGAEVPISGLIRDKLANSLILALIVTVFMSENELSARLFSIASYPSCSGDSISIGVLR